MGKKTVKYIEHVCQERMNKYGNIVVLVNIYRA